MLLHPLKTFLLTAVISLITVPVFANHITGGEMYYILTGQSGGNYSYHVVLKLYRDCNAPPGAAPLDDDASISIFNNLTFTSVWNNIIKRTKLEHQSSDNQNTCIKN